MTALHLAVLSAPPVNNHGWGRYTRDLITALATLSVRTTLITSTDAPADPDLPLVGYHRLLPSLVPAPRLSSLRILVALPAVARMSADCDVIHVIAEPYMLAVPPSRPTVVTAHGTYLPRTVARRGFGSLYRLAYRRALIICVSRYTEAAVLKAVPRLHTTVIVNGVNVARFEQPGTPQPKRGPTILAVGQIKARKGYHILAQAMKRVRQAIPDAEAIFIGEDSDKAYRQSIEAQLAADGIGDAVRILGRVPEDVLLGWYHSADVFALPAVNTDDQFEGFGLVYLEANVAGLPAVGTYGCGAEDAIKHGETGYLVPQNDVLATADALIGLLSDSAQRQHMGSAAQRHAQAHTWDQIAQRVVALYRELVE